MHLVKLLAVLVCVLSVAFAQVCNPNGIACYPADCCSQYSQCTGDYLYPPQQTAPGTVCKAGMLVWASECTTPCPVAPVATSTNAPATPTQAAPTQAPATVVPATQAPATQAPATQAPATQAPATQAPVAAATEKPSTSSSDCTAANQGVMRCSGGAGYQTCANGAWVSQACGGGLVCKPAGDLVYCDYNTGGSVDVATQAPATAKPTSAPPAQATQKPIAQATPAPTPAPATQAPATPAPTQKVTITPTPAPTTSGSGSASGDVDKVCSSSTLSSIFTEADFKALFPHANGGALNNVVNQHAIFNYSYLISAAARYPQFACNGDKATRLREVAAFLAQTSQETSGWWAGQPYNWGYYFSTEVGCTNTGCTQYCDSSNTDYPCAAGKGYYGRGPIQLSWNYNYGQVSQELFGSNVLLTNPDKIFDAADTAFTTALWFWMTPQNPKPSCHDVMTGKWTPTAQDLNAGRKPGFGMVTNIINGGLECGHTTPQNVINRVGYYNVYTTYFGVSAGDNVFCDTQRSF